METVQECLDAYLEQGEDAFLAKHGHPFLIYPEKKSVGGFSSYHTRMADREAGARIAATGREMKQFRILPPNASADGKYPAKLLVGRAEERDFTIDHSTVSKRHAVLVFDEERQTYKLGDAGSTNGTFVNGHSVEAGDPVYIRDGSIVSFGDCDYMFFSPTGFVDLLKRLKAESDLGMD